MRFRKKEGRIGHRQLTLDDLDMIIALCEVGTSGYLETSDKEFVRALKSCQLAVIADGQMPDAIRSTAKLRDSLPALIQATQNGGTL